MKKCPKCGNRYADYMKDCTFCNVAVEECEDIGVSEWLCQIYQKIKSFINNHMPKVKIYHIAIIYIVLIAAIPVFYLCGTAKKYDDSYITKTFQSKMSDFDTLTKQQAMYKEHKSTQKSLNSEITEIQNKIDTITAFEEKQDTYNSEIQDLSNQVNNLSSQKTQKEKTLNDIEYELSLY